MTIACGKHYVVCIQPQSNLKWDKEIRIFSQTIQCKAFGGFGGEQKVLVFLFEIVRAVENGYKHDSLIDRNTAYSFVSCHFLCVCEPVHSIDNSDTFGISQAKSCRLFYKYLTQTHYIRVWHTICIINFTQNKPTDEHIRLLLHLNKINDSTTLL